MLTLAELAKDRELIERLSEEQKLLHLSQALDELIELEEENAELTKDNYDLKLSLNHGQMQLGKLFDEIVDLKRLLDPYSKRMKLLNLRGISKADLRRVCYTSYHRFVYNYLDSLWWKQRLATSHRKSIVIDEAGEHKALYNITIQAVVDAVDAFAYKEMHQVFSELEALGMIRSHIAEDGEDCWLLGKTWINPKYLHREYSIGYPPSMLPSRETRPAYDKVVKRKRKGWKKRRS